VDYFIGLIKRRHCRDIAGDARAMGKLRRESERAKRALSCQRQVRVEVEKLVDGVHLSEQLTRARFEELNGELCRKMMVPVRKALADAGLGKADIDDIVLVGGSTWIPKVRQAGSCSRTTSTARSPLGVGASTPTRPSRTAPPSREPSSAATTSTTPDGYGGFIMRRE
jgi:hypothetical protein